MVMLNLNLPDDVAEKLRAYQREHGLENDAATIEALLEAETERVKRLDDWKGLLDLAGTVEFDEDHGPR